MHVAAGSLCFAVISDRRKALRADHVLDAAGVLCGGVRVYAEPRQALGQKLMALIDHLRNLPAVLGQVDKSGVGDGDMVSLAQMLHGDTDAGFLEAQLVCNVHGADDRKSFAQNQYRLQIVFARLVAVHLLPLSFRLYQQYMIEYTTGGAYVPVGNPSRAGETVKTAAFAAADRRVSAADFDAGGFPDEKWG